ncbi:hypothetical protein [Halalkalibacter alkalisediminis]|uniref:DUF4830 domain-containing protein n=2 Tax=Halalkalibacter alkalisediminis TaxID=935616 RepID=A0ABV6NL98_9BACI|nr:hypothetical protein [Halalkalibacter alkalisediminis]
MLKSKHGYSSNGQKRFKNAKENVDLKSKKRVAIVVIVMLCVVVSINLLQKDLWEVNEELLREQITSIEQSAETINLLDVTPFEWDVVYSFDPYTSKDKVYETVGYKWDNISETVSEGMNQIVFMKEEKVICYLYGYPENKGYGIYFSGDTINNVAEMLKANDNLTFRVFRSSNYIYLKNY